MARFGVQVNVRAGSVLSFRAASTISRRAKCMLKAMPPALRTSWLPVHWPEPGTGGRCGQSQHQGDVKFADTLRQMGVAITMGDNWIEAAATGKLKAIDADLNHIPDAAMTIAVAALAADGTTTLRNIEAGA
jgi:UDP-N-acetylglucosamine enolpyruvyl transferase